MKKILSALLALCMLCALFPAGALGEEAPFEPYFEPEELLPEELLPEPALAEEALPDQPEPEPLIEDLPALPADLIEVPLPQTMEEAEAYESRSISGTVNASSLKDYDEIILKDDTTLVMDVNRKVRSIYGRGHSLTVEGTGELTVDDYNGETGIDVRAFTSYAPVEIIAGEDAIYTSTSDYELRADIEIHSDLHIYSVKGYGLRTFEGHIRILGGGDVRIASRNGIETYGDVTLNGNITIESDDGPAIGAYGGVYITGGTVTAISNDTGLTAYGVKCSRLEITDGALIADASHRAVEAEEIVIHSPLGIVLPINGKPGVSETLWYGDVYTVCDGDGHPATHIEIGTHSPVTGYVKRCYLEILGRDGEPEGIAYWTNVLQAHQAAGVDIVVSFVDSQEFKDGEYSEEHTIWKLYAAMMDREPDDEGLEHWKYMMEKLGCSSKLVMKQFADSQEFKDICAAYNIIPGTSGSVILETRDLNPLLTGFAARCYRTTLKRDGDPEGLNYWAGLLLNKIQTPHQMALNFLHSAEFIKRDLDNEDYLCVLYDLYMGEEREIDEEGFRYWSDQLFNETLTRDQVADSFAASQEFQEILKTYGL